VAWVRDRREAISAGNREARAMQCKATQTPEIDLPALREKYRHERDKRIRSEGGNQYVETADGFVDYYEADPYSPAVVRDPISEDIGVAIVGGGFAGLICAARIKQAGVSNLHIIDFAGDFGGAWYWNRYPGIQCDTDSCCYLPLLEEVN
jgi:cyclohexanone monooxygenase